MIPIFAYDVPRFPSQTIDTVGFGSDAVWVRRGFIVLGWRKHANHTVIVDNLPDEAPHELARLERRITAR